MRSAWCKVLVVSPREFEFSLWVWEREIAVVFVL